MSTRLPLLATSLLTLLLAGCGGNTPATLPTTPDSPPASPAPAPVATASLRWSDVSTWGGALPVAGQKVTLPAGERVLLDVSPPALAGLTIPPGSALEFARQDLTLKSEWIMVHGELRVGSETEPFAQHAEIVLTDTVPGENVMGMGDRVLGVMDGTLELHGQSRLAWTRLAQTAPAGSTSLNLERAPDWVPGDALTLASTDFNPSQTEQVTVQRVSGTQVTLSAPLKYGHWAETTTLGGFELNERAEVGLLTHNIRVSASDEAASSGLGAHTMIMGTAQARIEGTEFLRVGQRNALRRYPVHFHQLGSVGSSYFRGNSLHDSFNRCLVIHGTRDLAVQNNVTYNSVGHCLFLEDGDETGNRLEGNLVTLVRRPNSKLGETPLLPSDKRAAAFWITNPANTVKGNVAAGVEGVGFWYALPEHPTGLGAANGAGTWPRRTPLGTFDGNIAHSGDRGLDVDNGPDADGVTHATSYDPVSMPADPKSAAVPADFTGFLAYKQRDHGAWLRGENLSLSGARLADNGVGVTFAAHQSGLHQALLVGETANVGSPESWEVRGEGGRSLPRPWDADFPVRGFQFYDGLVQIDNVALAGFVPNAVRQASGVGYLTENAFALNPQNQARALHWLDSSARVYFPAAAANKDGDLAATFLDTDGSVTGQAGRSVTASPLLKDAPDCVVSPAWNASVCAGQYARFWLEDVTGGRIGPVSVQNPRGSRLSLSGVPDQQKHFTTTVRLGEGYTVAPAGTSGHLRLGILGRQPGDVLRLSLPISGDPALYRDWWIDERNRLKKVTLSALETTTGDSYALEGGLLHLKLVVKGGAQAATLDICSAALCP
ncbi:G8 domain-containing protein [Deinococcus navajonensis]|uniref:G8 domain-containing protein n=1 Tax=Deinococcus navajonensis TaxID=309884 RepID=A0ABV8XNN5_9DEIO